jgi:hypothetical protein
LTLAVAIAAGIAAYSPQTAAGSRMAACHAVFLRVALTAGETFSQEIGGGLELRLMPERFFDPAARDRQLDGWQIVVVPAHAIAGAPPPQDRIYPANLPLRFNPWQSIGTTYGVTAADKLRRDITYRFVWRAADYDQIAALASEALWPYTAADPQNAGARYLDVLRTLPTAMIRLHPLRYELSESGMSIRNLALRIAITAPRNFAFPGGLARKPAVCPAAQG